MMPALGLAACAREGGLRRAPSAGLTTPQSCASRPSLGEETNGPTPPPADDRARAAPASATASPPPPPPPPKKPFFLDFLLAKCCKRRNLVTVGRVPYNPPRSVISPRMAG